MLLADNAGDSEYRHQQCNGDGADDQTHECDHEWFDQRSGCTNGILKLFAEENRDFVGHLPNLTGFLAGPKHLNNTRCNQVAMS